VVVGGLRPFDFAEGAEIGQTAPTPRLLSRDREVEGEVGLVGVARSRREAEAHIPAPVVALSRLAGHDADQLGPLELLDLVPGPDRDQIVDDDGGAGDDVLSFERVGVLAGGPKLDDVVPVEIQHVELVAVELDGAVAHTFGVALEPLAGAELDPVEGLGLGRRRHEEGALGLRRRLLGAGWRFLGSRGFRRGLLGTGCRFLESPGLRRPVLGECGGRTRRENERH
jgi:hypothetical protein